MVGNREQLIVIHFSNSNQEIPFSTGPYALRCVGTEHRAAVHAVSVRKVDCVRYHSCVMGVDAGVWSLPIFF
jgi:hypothetical protein